MTVAQQLLALELDTLELSLHETLLDVTISRPEVLNALSPAVIAELRLVFGLMRAHLGVADNGDVDWSVRGIMLTGAGAKAFVAGADISAMRDMTSEEARTYAAEAQELTTWIETLQVPVVAAVNGFALGGGCELALSCDYVFASENASFGQPEVALGLIPGFGGSVRLTHFVGVAAAREMILTGRRIDASEALQRGLALRVLPDIGALHEAAHESLRLAAAQSPVAVAAAKRTVLGARHLSTDDGLALELEAFASRFGTPDMVEGTSAFVEKRRAAFPGR